MVYGGVGSVWWGVGFESCLIFVLWRVEEYYVFLVWYFKFCVGDGVCGVD